MIESYAVGAVFKIVDEASRPLSMISDKLGSLDRVIAKTQEALNKLGAFKGTALLEGIGGIEKKLGAVPAKAMEAANGINRALQTTDTAITGTGSKIVGLGNSFGTMDEKASAALNGVAGSFGRADTSIATTTSAVDRLGQRLREVGTDARGIGAIPRIGSGGFGGGSHTRPGSTSTGGHAGSSRHGAGIDAGIFGFMGFEAVKGGTEDILRHGMEIAHVQEQMKQGGMSMGEIGTATAAARVEAEKYGLSIVKVMEDIKELRFPFGGTEHAVKFIDPLERMRVVLNSVAEGKGNSAADSVYEMARAGELKGLNNAQDYIRYFDDMTKAISATGGKVDPRSYMQVTQYGKVASFGWDEEFYTKYLPTLMQTMKPSTAGQSLMSLFNTLESGAVTKRSLGQMWDLGLIGDASKIVYNKQGDPVGMNPGAVRGYQELAKNPLKWAEDVLTPLLEKQFGDLGNDANKERTITGLGGLFGNRNTAAAIAELALRSKSFERDAGLIGKATGIGGADQILAHDPTAAVNNFTAAWGNLLMSLGKPAVQGAIDGLNLLSQGLNSISNVVAAHPEIGKDFVGMAAGLAGGLGLLAAIGLTAFVPGGIFMVAVTTIGGALAGLAAIHWEDIYAIGSKIAKLGASIGDGILGLWHSLVAKIRSIPGMSAILGDDVSGIAGHPAHPHTPTPLSRQGTMDMMQGLGMVPNTTGLPFGFTPMAFTSGANDNGSAIDLLAQGVFKGLQLYAAGGVAGLGGGAGGGIVQAAYTTFGSSGGGLGGLSGGAGFAGSGDAVSLAERMLGANGAQASAVLHSKMTPGEWCADFVNGVLKGSGGQGVNSSMARAFSNWGHAIGLEGARRGDVILERHGDHIGHVGLATGRMLRDAAGHITALEMISGNYGHAVRRNWERVGLIGGLRRGEGHSNAGLPPKRISPGAPASHDSRPMIQARLEVPVHIDGKKIAHHVAHHLIAAMEHPTAVGGPDTYGSWQGPATPLNDAA